MRLNFLRKGSLTSSGVPAGFAWLSALSLGELSAAAGQTVATPDTGQWVNELATLVCGVLSARLRKVRSVAWHLGFLRGKDAAHGRAVDFEPAADFRFADSGAMEDKY
jgi:hypothetical protein